MTDNSASMLTEEDIAARPISVTLGRLVGASLLISVTTWIGAWLAPLTGVDEPWKISALGCAVGLSLAQKSVFGDADVLDRMRWRHHWSGDLLGYWAVCLLLTLGWTSKIPHNGPLHAREVFSAEITAYVIASVVGCIVGLLNVKRCDTSDKRKIIDRIWGAQHQRSG
jgi:hypothetical protein